MDIINYKLNKYRKINTGKGFYKLNHKNVFK